MADRQEMIWLELPTGGRIEKSYLNTCITIARKESGYTKVSYEEVVKDKKGHAHCEICSLVIASERVEYTSDGGWFSNDTWVCDDCYKRFVAPPSFNIEVEKLKRVPKRS